MKSLIYVDDTSNRPSKAWMGPCNQGCGCWDIILLQQECPQPLLPA